MLSQDLLRAPIPEKPSRVCELVAPGPSASSHSILIEIFHVSEMRQGGMLQQHKCPNGPDIVARWFGSHCRWETQRHGYPGAKVQNRNPDIRTRTTEGTPAPSSITHSQFTLPDLIPRPNTHLNHAVYIHRTEISAQGLGELRGKPLNGVLLPHIGLVPEHIRYPISVDVSRDLVNRPHGILDLELGLEFELLRIATASSQSSVRVRTDMVSLARNLEEHHCSDLPSIFISPAFCPPHRNYALVVF